MEQENTILVAELIEEINRCRELVKLYEGIGMPGLFGKAMIHAEIIVAEKSLASGDTVMMLKAFAKLKECK